MQVTARALWTPKAGNRSEEYEDAFWPARMSHRAGSRFRFAVADGATETSFAGLWARRLVRAYGLGGLAEGDWAAHLRQQQASWYAEVTSRPLPWYAEEKVQSGAYAALLGLELAAAEDAESENGAGEAGGENRAATGTWQAVAVGDCCLVHWRGSEPLALFPAQSSDFFTSRPYLLSSNAARNGVLEEQVQRTGGTWRAGDHFALMSDALAAMVLRSLETDESLLPLLARMLREGQQRRFAQWVHLMRQQGYLRNDDVTLVLIAVGDPAAGSRVAGQAEA